MLSTMQNSPLTVAEILRYAVNVHGDRTVTTATGDGFRHATYRQVGQQAARLANDCAGRVVAQYGNRLKPEELQQLRKDFEAANAKG